uniref:Uncharacterized protein n=1 Tax=Timema poppense TaxID=170557 RepID=A0A7R9DCI3_TIMPO|nr:unnamed protein product [Timema poppensis]
MSLRNKPEPKQHHILKDKWSKMRTKEQFYELAKKQCILSESRFDFLKDLVKALPDSSTFEAEDGAGVSPLTVPSTKAEPPR